LSQSDIEKEVQAEAEEIIKEAEKVELDDIEQYEVDNDPWSDDGEVLDIDV
jgi:rubrerythrin